MSALPVAYFYGIDRRHTIQGNFGLTLDGLPYFWPVSQAYLTGSAGSSPFASTKTQTLDTTRAKESQGKRGYRRLGPNASNVPESVCSPLQFLLTFVAIVSNFKKAMEKGNIPILFVLFFLPLLILGSPSISHADRNQKVLRVCDLADDVGLRMDPHRQFDERNENIVSHVFERLLALDIDGNPKPSLAQSWKRLDKNTVQFKLRKNVFFHNKEPCDAQAAKFSIERNILKSLASPSSHVLKSIKRVDVIDSRTFNIVTKYPDGILLNRLCVAGYVVPPGYVYRVGNKEFEKHPIGTGPFIFGQWTKGKELVLDKNTDYWRPGVPRVDKIVFKFANAQERVAMLLTGDVDMITNFQAAALQSIEKQGFKTIKEPSFTVMSINFNLRNKNGPFQNKLVRKAVNYAVDKHELIEKVRLNYGIGRASLGMPGEFGYNPYVKPYPYDPVKARDLLREAGYEKGFTATALIDEIDGGAKSALAVELKRQLARVNIDLKVKGGNGNRLVVGPRVDPSLPQFAYDMFVRTCPDPIGHIIFIEGMVYYASDSPWSLLHNDDFDRLYNRIVRTIDPREQNKLCHALEEMVHEECFSLFTYQEIKLYAMTDRIFYTPYITGMLNLRETSIVQD